MGGGLVDAVRNVPSGLRMPSKWHSLTIVIRPRIRLLVCIRLLVGVDNPVLRMSGPVTPRSDRREDRSLAAAKRSGRRPETKGLPPLAAPLDRVALPQRSEMMLTFRVFYVSGRPNLAVRPLPNGNLPDSDA